jgi:uncharacterized protein DUF4911
LNLTNVYFRVDRNHIGFLNFILDAYEGLAYMSTIDRSKGIVLVRMAQKCEADVFSIIQSLNGKFMIERMRDRIG